MLYLIWSDMNQRPKTPAAIPTLRNPSEFIDLYQTESNDAGAIPTLEWGIGVHRLEDTRHWFTFPTAPARARFYDGLLVTGGEIQRQVGLFSATLTPNTLLLTAEGMVTAVDHVSDDATGYYFLFERSFAVNTERAAQELADNSFFQPDRIPVLALTSDQTAFLDALLKLLQVETQQRPFTATAQALLTALLTKASDLHRSQPAQATSSTSDARLTASFQKLVQQQFAQWHGTKPYADALAITANHLNRAVKRTTGQSASQYITDWLMLEACVLLKNTTLTITEIADQLGYTDPFYFGRSFRNQTGHTPTDYRKKPELSG